MIFFRWTHVTWSGPGDERLEQAAKASISSSAEKGAHSRAGRSGSSSRTDRSQGRSAAELYVLWSASHNSGMVWQGCPLYWIASQGGSFRPLTHSIRSQGRRLVLAISSIFASKNLRFAALVALRKVVQFSGVVSSRYWRRVSKHVS